jgi:hypothetical protein
VGELNPNFVKNFAHCSTSSHIKTPQPTHPRKLLQLDHQQQKDLEPSKINMKIDVVI